MTNLLPTDITKDTVSGVEIASFDYYSGINYAKENDYKQTTEFDDVVNNHKFLVCCGDVMLRVQPSQFTNITRRPL